VDWWDCRHGVAYMTNLPEYAMIYALQTWLSIADISLHICSGIAHMFWHCRYGVAYMTNLPEYAMIYALQTWLSIADILLHICSGIADIVLHT
jgi:hypothetical protein